MISVKKEGVILQATDLDFENDAVLNPAVFYAEQGIHVFYRAVRKGNFSSIGHALLNSPLKVESRDNRPILKPEFDYESHGMEDPRIVNIEGLFYLTYIAFDGTNALGALATSADLRSFNKQGIIVPKVTLADFDKLTKSKPEINEKYLRYNHGANFLADKDLVFFPRRINGMLMFLHRIKPDIQLVAVKDIANLDEAFWINYFQNFNENIALTPKYPHEASYVGGGCPPVETADGWLVLYHGVKDVAKGYEYACCAALVNLDDPRKEIARLPYPLFKPELDYELKGDVDDVCFPTGTVLNGDTLYIYYGAADELIACASVSLSGLLKELLAYKN